jgi:hypothetical protein
MSTAVYAVRVVIRSSTAKNKEKRSNERKMAKCLDAHSCRHGHAHRVIWRHKRSVGGSIRTAGSKGRHNGDGTVLNKARKVRSTETRPTICSIARGLGVRQWPMEKLGHGANPIHVYHTRYGADTRYDDDAKVKCHSVAAAIATGATRMQLG